MKPFWSLHSHSKHSANDALPAIPDMVAKAVDLGYPALGLTDHGTVSGAVQLYKTCRKAGIEPFPGEEFYITPDREAKVQANNHITIAAYSEQGYRNLVGLHNMAQANFFYKPRIDLADISSLAQQGRLQGLVASTGCYFGLVQQTLEKQGTVAARRLVAAMAGWFPRLYVELHDHGVTHDNGTTDADFVDELVWIADSLGVPYIIAQDSHYIEPADQSLHDALKTLVSWSEDPSEAIFPGGPYCMADNEFLLQSYPADVLETANDNLWDLAQRAHLRLPELEQFHMRVPDVTLTGDADQELADRVWADLDGDGGPEPLRLADELDVITYSGFAGYLLLVADVCDFMRSKGIWFQTRGSASGSLVCYRLGITQIEPISQGLRMDRFMSKDRMKPPDVDLDVEHERRDEVVAYLEQRFTVRQIGSHMKYSVVADPDNEDESKGSLLVRYFSSAKKRGQEIKTWKEIPYSDQKLLQQLGDMKLNSQAGTHAAGYIVSPDEQAAKQLPLTWIASRKAMVTSYAMKDVEALGFVKLDLLGLRTMTSIKVTCEALGWSQKDFEAIPMDDKETYQRISAGNTGGVFQLDGKAMQRGCKELKPKRFDDIVAAQALYRPATMQSGATADFIKRRRGQEPVPDRHPDIMAETKETYGVLLYQEQVLAVLRRLGMDQEEMAGMLAAIKASNEHSAGAKVALAEAKPRITSLAHDRDWSEVDIVWLLDALVAYGEYSFNKAHACSYGLTAYRTAYLAAHHPVEFWLGVLTAFADHWKENIFVSLARKENVRILGPHVNHSGVTYRLDNQRTGKAIRKGLVSVKGIGMNTATELIKHQPFSSLEELALKVVPRKVSGVKSLALGIAPEECGGAIAALAEYRALTGLS